MSHLVRTSVLAGALAALAASPVAAAPPTLDELKQFASPEAIAKWVGGATLDRSLSLPSGIELTAGAKGSGATVKASRKVNDADGITTISLTATAPFDKDKEEGGFALDSLTSGASLKFEVTFGGLVGDRDDTHAAAVDLCKAIALERKVPAPTDCDSQWVSENDPDQLDRFDRLGFRSDAFAWSASGFAKVGHSSFKYVDAAAFKEEERTETPWSLGMTVSRQPLWKRRLYMLKYEHQRGYKAQSIRTVCPAPTGAPVTCLSGPLGPPKHDDKDLVSFEVRQRFSDFYGLAVTATYDLGSEDFGIDAPIYLIGGKDYSGGVRVTYKRENKSTKSDKDDLAIGVFVSRALTLY